MIIRHRIAVYYNKYELAEAPRRWRCISFCVLRSFSFHSDPSNPSINHPPRYRLLCATGPQQISVTVSAVSLLYLSSSASLSFHEIAKKPLHVVGRKDAVPILRQEQMSLS